MTQHPTPVDSTVQKEKLSRYFNALYNACEYKYDKEQFDPRLALSVIMCLEKLNEGNVLLGWVSGLFSRFIARVRKGEMYGMKMAWIKVLNRAAIVLANSTMTLCFKYDFSGKKSNKPLITQFNLVVASVDP